MINVTIKGHEQTAATRVTEVTYEQLVTKITNSELVAGGWYKITDNAMIYTDYDGTITTCDTEPILVLALSSNKISNVAFSETYPEDIIYYNPTLTTILGYYNFQKGCIYRRIDTKRNIDIPCDWRNLKIKAFKLDDTSFPTLTNGNEITTDQGQVYRKGVTNDIYYRFGDTGSFPFTDGTHWVLMPIKYNNYCLLSDVGEIEFGMLEQTTIITLEDLSGTYQYRKILSRGDGVSYNDLTNSLYNIKINTMNNPCFIEGFGVNIESLSTISSMIIPKYTITNSDIKNYIGLGGEITNSIIKSFQGITNFIIESEIHEFTDGIIKEIIFSKINYLESSAFDTLNNTTIQNSVRDKGGSMYGCHLSNSKYNKYGTSNNSLIIYSKNFTSNILPDVNYGNFINIYEEVNGYNFSANSHIANSIYPKFWFHDSNGTLKLYYFNSSNVMQFVTL